MTTAEPRRFRDLKPPGHQGAKVEQVPLPAELDRVAKQVVDSAFKVHTALGPGLLESVYEICLAHELRSRGLQVEKQVVLPVIYDGIRIDGGLRLDLVVQQQLIVEIKAVEQMLPVFDAQVLTYLRLTGKRIGLLVNFNVPRIKDGIKRMIL
jgi:GxxExxY protein